MQQETNNSIGVNRKSESSDKSRRMKMLTTYMDNCIHMLTVVFLADLTVRLFKVLREYFVYTNHYLPERRLLRILQRVFSYNWPTLALFLAVMAAALLRFAADRHNFLLAPPLVYAAYIPLYWIFYGVQLSYSPLDYANWVRENHGLDYADGMASNYFHGYLKLTLPSYNAHPGIRERIALYSAKNHVKFAVNRLVILVPNTMYVNSMIESKILEKAQPLEVIMKNRAGVERPFKNDVYRFTLPINNTFYYIALEGATPMLSFFEAMNMELSSTWQMREMQREILFKFYKHLKKLLSEWPETQQEVELVLYNAKTDDGRLQDVGEVLLAHITNLWNEGRA